MQRNGLKRASWTALAIVLLLIVALASWEPFFAEQPGTPPPAKAYIAEIVRDEFGVPHIHGRADPDVAFGVAMAHAEDDFSTLQDVVAMTRGDATVREARHNIGQIQILDHCPQAGSTPSSCRSSPSRR